MARTEHLPIYKQAYDLCLYIEQVVRGFARYHKPVLIFDFRVSCFPAKISGNHLKLATCSLRLGLRAKPALIKKTQRTPAADIRLAQNRQDF